jgi:hypothetical protein
MIAANLAWLAKCLKALRMSSTNRIRVTSWSAQDSGELPKHHSVIQQGLAPCLHAQNILSSSEAMRGDGPVRIRTRVKMYAIAIHQFVNAVLTKELDGIQEIHLILLAPSFSARPAEIIGVC